MRPKPGEVVNPSMHQGSLLPQLIIQCGQMTESDMEAEENGNCNYVVCLNYMLNSDKQPHCTVFICIFFYFNCSIYVNVVNRGNMCSPGHGLDGLYHHVTSKDIKAIYYRIKLTNRKK